MKTTYKTKFIAFMESICSKAGCTEAIKPLTDGFNTYLESIGENGNPEVWLHVGSGYDRVPINDIGKAIASHDKVTMWSLDKDILDKAKADFDSTYNPYYVKTSEVHEEDDLPYWSLDIIYNDVVQNNKVQRVKLYNKITDYVNAEPAPDKRIGTSDGLGVYQASPEMSAELRDAMNESIDDPTIDDPQEWASYWKVKFPTVEAAQDAEYELRDACGPYVNTYVDLDNGEVWIENDGPEAEHIVKDWFGTDVELVVKGPNGGEKIINFADACKNLCQEAGCPDLGNALVEGLENIIHEPSMIQVEFSNEDSAYDALNGLDHFKEYNLHHEWDPYFDDVEYGKDGNIIWVKGHRPAFLDYIKGYIEETDIDSVVDYGG